MSLIIHPDGTFEKVESTYELMGRFLIKGTWIIYTDLWADTVTYRRTIKDLEVNVYMDLIQIPKFKYHELPDRIKALLLLTT